MSQSGFIAGMLLAAFVLWLAVNDRLSVYTAVLWGDTAQKKPSGNLFVPGANGGVEGPTESDPKNNSSGGGGIGLPGSSGGSSGGSGSFVDSISDWAKSLEPLALDAVMAGG